MHDEFPAVTEFIESVFSQLMEGQTEISFGQIAMLAKATPELLLGIFK